MKSNLIGIDLAKNMFQVCALNRAGKVQSNTEISRARLMHHLASYEPTIVAMESCSSAHYWARRMQSLGHEIRLLPAQHVKPFVRGGKNDARDALAICEAALRPGLHCVPIKSLVQQDLQALHRSRLLCVRQSTAIANQIRGIAREYGVCFAMGIRAVLKNLPTALAATDNELTPTVRELLFERYQLLLQLRQQIDILSRRITQQARTEPAFARLQAMPGIGPISASALLAAIGHGQQFSCGRQVSAWLGLVPRQHGSGGKLKLHGMTKSGDRYLRTMLIHGARAAITCGKDKSSPLQRWIKPVIARRGFNKAVVALANKNARIGWLIIARDAHYDPGKAFG